MKQTDVLRRRVLRGMLQGAVIGVGLPLLDCFLNDNGTARADGSPLPVCFGTWFWSLGLGVLDWAPRTIGKEYALPEHLRMLSEVQDRINLYSGLQVFADGGNPVHSASPQAIMTGSTEGVAGGYRRSVDSIIGQRLGAQTRFPSVEVNCHNDPSWSWSARNDNLKKPAEVSPSKLYRRLFVDGFQDPNARSHTPDPGVLLRKSSLSVVTEERQSLLPHLGVSDRQRVDEYFTSLRELEQKLALELEPPEPLAACTVPTKPPEDKPGLLLETVQRRHEQFSQLIAHALACGQTRVFNLSFGLNAVKALGDPATNHTYSHDERIDPALGYQPMTYWFGSQHMRMLVQMIKALDGVREGNGTLLDRTLMLAYTDHSDARVHRLENIPLITAGRAGGAMKTGMHVSAIGDSCARVGLTCQQAMGVPARSWGLGSNQVERAITEVLA